MNSERFPLPPAARHSIQTVQRLVDQKQYVQAEQVIAGTLVLAGTHPRVLGLLGAIHQGLGRVDEAIVHFREALAASPDDVELMDACASALGGAGRWAEAIELRQRLCRLRGEAADWFDLGAALDAHGAHAEALAAAEVCLARASSHEGAGFLRARSLQALGRIDDTVAQYRALIQSGKRKSHAWFGLLDVKTAQLEAGELEALRRLAYGKAHDLGSDDRTMAMFAYGRALEAEGRHAEAFEAIASANSAVRANVSWDAGAHRRLVDALTGIDWGKSADDAASRGSEVIFVVGMPRSGSTLVEQILASHPRVEGASELSDLRWVIEQESRRRGVAWPAWAPRASEEDWGRLGRSYLARTERWRTRRPVSTDKAPGNWVYAGALRRMLPGSRIIDCRRDAVETCWSCFKQRFGPGGAEFSYDLGDLASYWNDYVRLSDRWRGLDPGRILLQSYEALLEAPETQIRSLLAFCGLPYDAACLDFHLAERPVRTASSAQVRQPLRRSTARTGEYGTLLDAFRRQLVADG